MHKLILLLVACLLAACATPAQRYRAAIARTHVDSLRTARSQAELERVLANGDAAQAWFARSCVARQPNASACRDSCGYQACRTRWDDLSSNLESIEASGSALTADSGTNNQESGVDEGGLAKRSGDHLFILRDDYLHVLRVRRDGVAVLDYPSRLSVLDPGERDEAWYDEILVHDHDVILVGFNYAADASEILHFRLDEGDRLTRLGRYAIRSSDYFSGENYATRIVGDDLVFVLSMALDDVLDGAWPSWTRRDTSTPAWHPLLEPDDVFLPLVIAEDPVLSMVLECPIAEGLALERCRARAVIAPDAGTHYVTGHAVYLAVSEWPPEFYRDVATSVMDFDRYWALRHQRWTSIYRFPFGADRGVSVARIDGEIDDQFQFKERDGVLFAAGEIQYGEEREDLRTEVRLRRIADADFSVKPEGLAPLLSRTERRGSLEAMRFDDERLWMSFEHSDRDLSELIVAPLNGAASNARVLDFAACRLQPVGAGMIAMNSWAPPATIAYLRDTDGHLQIDTQRLPGFEIDADRSQAFNFRAMGDYGTLMTVPIDPSREHHSGGTRRSDFAFLGLKDERLTEIGVLDMQAFGERNSCANGCDDWYGDARAIPVDGRWIFLSGDLVLEAELRGDKLQPLRSLLLMQDERAKP
jgi:hypothetical protein